MARKTAKAEPPKLDELLPAVRHLAVQSLPFTPAWRKAARKRWVELTEIGVRQKEFAAWVGCAQGSISNLLGEKEPVFGRHDYLERISTALGVPLPVRARIDIVANDIGEDQEHLAKVLDLLELYGRKKQP